MSRDPSPYPVKVQNRYSILFEDISTNTNPNIGKDGISQREKEWKCLRDSAKVANVILPKIEKGKTKLDDR